MNDKLTEIVEQAQRELIEIGVLVSDMTRDEREQCDSIITRACGEAYRLGHDDIFHAMDDENQQLHQLVNRQRRANYRLFAAASNYFLAKSCLTVPEVHEHEQILRKIVEEISSQPSCAQKQPPAPA
jgi:hypothetical protein